MGRHPAAPRSRLTSARTSPLTALQAGRDLLADDIRAQIASETAATRETRQNAPARYRRRGADPLWAARSQDPPPLRLPPARDQLHHRPQLSQEGS